MNEIPDKREQIQKKAGNPIVVKAKKAVTRRDKFNRWFKRHEAVIYISLATATQIVAGFWIVKRNEAKFRKKLSIENKDFARELNKTAEGAGRNVERLTKTAEKQIATNKTLESNAQRLKRVEDALKIPEFHEYLAKKHGITDAKRVKK